MEKKRVSIEELEAVVTDESVKVEKEDEANARAGEVISDPGDGSFNLWCDENCH